SKMDAAIHFIPLWQDFLAQMHADNVKAARKILSDLGESTSYPIIPRSEILSRLQALYEAEAKAKPTPVSLIPDKAVAICSALVNPADITSAIDQLKALRQEFSLNVDPAIISELDGLNSIYKQIEAGVSTPINLLENSSRFVALRLELISLALSRYLGLEEHPQPNETIGQFLDRLIARAKEAKNWPALLKAVEASRTIATRNSSINGPSSVSPWMPLRSFVIGQNQEQAGQYSSAVVSYQDSLRDTEKVVPVDVVRDRLATIKTNHPADFEEGMQRVLNPPAPTPAPNRYPPNFPPRVNRTPPVALPSASAIQSESPARQTPTLTPQEEIPSPTPAR
ncbi:MAG: hypothetical protein QOD99_385, partial [Chthoniobacter sp.]|nr:hypothetical protein [Chthoniobacter sp.]